MTTEIRQHYKLNVMVEEEWFNNDLVFPGRAQAKAYGEYLLECGAIDEYSLVETDAPIRYPPDKYKESGEIDGSPSDNGDPVFSPVNGGLDWDALLDVMILCPSLFHSMCEDCLEALPTSVSQAIREPFYLETWDAY